MKAIQINRENLGTVMQLPCVEMCFKTVSGHFRFKGTFESKAHYARENLKLVMLKNLTGLYRLLQVSGELYQMVSIRE